MLKKLNYFYILNIWNNVWSRPQYIYIIVKSPLENIIMMKKYKQILKNIYKNSEVEAKEELKEKIE